MRGIRKVGVALGMSPSQVVCHLVLPYCMRSFATAGALGFGRAIGDTMLPLMVAGNAAQYPGSVFESVRSLTAHIGLVISTEKGSSEYNSLFAAAMILLMVSLLVTLCMRVFEGSLLAGKGEVYEG